MKKVKLVAFLGNPGEEYRRTRHNIAWLLSEELECLRDCLWQNKYGGRICRGECAGRQMIFFKPTAYMNRSGPPIQEVMSFYKLVPEEILVVHDDLELEFCRISFKSGGGLAGHNGLRSIAGSLGGVDFNRFRLGISKPERGEITPYVLGGFSPEEKERLPAYLAQAANIIQEGLKLDREEAINKYFKVNLCS
jgi:peptidyl-tRNA hydrolase, PTH1 family